MVPATTALHQLQLLLSQIVRSSSSSSSIVFPTAGVHLGMGLLAKGVSSKLQGRSKGSLGEVEGPGLVWMMKWKGLAGCYLLGGGHFLLHVFRNSALCDAAQRQAYKMLLWGTFL